MWNDDEKVHEYFPTSFDACYLSVQRANAYTVFIEHLDLKVFKKFLKHPKSEALRWPTSREVVRAERLGILTGCVQTH